MASGGDGSEEAGEEPAPSSGPGHASRASGPRPLAEAALCPAGDSRVEAPGLGRRGSRVRSLRGWPDSRRRSCAARSPVGQRVAMNLQMLSRELFLYLEHQVRVGFFGSGVGLSLILGFSVAYACYYLSSIAKVSGGTARAKRRAAGCFAGSDSGERSRSCGWQGRVTVLEASMLS